MDLLAEAIRHVLDDEGYIDMDRNTERNYPSEVDGLAHAIASWYAYLAESGDWKDPENIAASVAYTDSVLGNE